MLLQGALNSGAELANVVRVIGDDQLGDLTIERLANTRQPLRHASLRLLDHLAHLLSVSGPGWRHFCAHRNEAIIERSERRRKPLRNCPRTSRIAAMNSTLIWYRSATTHCNAFAIGAPA